jgi:uncharacterized caspase-like protein
LERSGNKPDSGIMARLLLLLGLAAFWVSHPCAAAELRVALVVGAAKYEHAPTLANTLDDAREMAAALKRLGFDVDLVLDPDRASLEAAVRRLGQRSRGADAALFYYSGHALESQGVNWVLPVSADVKDDRDLRFEALDLTTVLDQVEGSARVSLILLDACREDPFKQRLGASRDLGKSGLATVNAPVSGTFIAFATAPGVVAADGNGPHSPFTGSLLKYIETPGLELRQMMSKVRGDVEEATAYRQIPWDSSSLTADFFFNPAKAPPIANGAPPNPKLLEALASALTSATAKYREESAANYQTLLQHKALAVNLSANAAWRGGGYESAQEAQDVVLESCEVFFGTQCLLVALDDGATSEAGAGPRAIPRVQYAGQFDPQRIPGVREGLRRRPDLVGYLSAPSYKAAAYHPAGRVFVVTRAANQRAAEEAALAACNQDPTRNGGGPCYLYASSNEVVLPRRSTTPITAVTPNPKLAQALSALLPSATAQFRDGVAAAYQGIEMHKALAINRSIGRPWRSFSRASAQEAEVSDLEGCEFFFASPCVLVAVDDEIKSAATAPRSMPRVHYTGKFDPEWIPAIPQTARQRPDIVGYLSARGYKAAAFHPGGKLFIVTGAADQHAAEEQAITSCNQDPTRNAQSGPCYLYASMNEVVLPRRLTTPIAAAVAGVPAEPTIAAPAAGGEPPAAAPAGR